MFVQHFGQHELFLNGFYNSFKVEHFSPAGINSVPVCCRLRWRLVPHLQPQWGQDQSDDQHLSEVLQGAAGSWS